MSNESERMLMLLQELAALKDAGDSGSRVDIATRRRRLKEIRNEMKQLAARKKNGD